MFEKVGFLKLFVSEIRTKIKRKQLLILSHRYCFRNNRQGGVAIACFVEYSRHDGNEGRRRGGPGKEPASQPPPEIAVGGAGGGDGGAAGGGGGGEERRTRAVRGGEFLNWVDMRALNGLELEENLAARLFANRIAGGRVRRRAEGIEYLRFVCLVKQFV